MRKEKIQDQDVPGIVRRALKRELELLVQVIRALRKEIEKKRREQRYEKFGF